ncbi:hypothetical protein [Conexibacter sp. DBS9H8]|uniref:hypothetical protein n=1 Tax=Conexibacter sp. DBS9H8 TaxID=2937801 RepID=UPI0020101AD2|nr:hypothetical protein [Conexibacter sp. DBS9H8]
MTAATRDDARSRTTEVRSVEVDEPRLSPELNAELTDELREVVGEDSVWVPRDRVHPSQGDAVEHPGVRGMRVPRNWIVSQVAATWVIVGLIALITVVSGAGAWWVMGAAVLGLLVTMGLLIRTAFRMMANPERPAATTVARMEAEGVRDPERHFSDLVSEFTAGAKPR